MQQQQDVRVRHESSKLRTTLCVHNYAQLKHQMRDAEIYIYQNYNFIN